MLSLRRCLLLSLIVAIPVDACAEWRRVDPALPGGWGARITKIVEDRQRNLWFVSDGNGVFRSNGIRWDHFGRADGIGGDIVHDLVDDDAGRIWIATENGVSYFDESGSHFTKGSELGFTLDCYYNDDIHALHVGRSGSVYASMAHGVSRWDSTGWRPVGGCYADAATQILEDRSGRIWASEANRLAMFDGLQWRGSLDAYDIHQILEDGAGTIWAFAYEGVYRYVDSQWTRVTESELGVDPGSGWDGAAVALPDGSVIYASSPGTFRFMDGRWSRIGVVSPSFGIVTQLLADSLGSLWRNDPYGAGVGRLDGSHWRTLAQAADGQRIFEDRSGHVWRSTAAGTVFVQDGPLLERFPFTLGPTSIFEDSTGFVWAVGATQFAGRGAYRFNGEEWVALATGGDAGGDDHAIVDHTGAIWLTVWGRGIGRFDGVNWKFYSSDSLDFGTCESLLEDQQGNIWVSTSRSYLSSYGGVARFDGAQWITVPGVATTHALHLSAAGRVWGLTESSACEYDGTQWTCYSLGSWPTSWFADPLGPVLIGGLSGLHRIEGGHVTRLMSESVHDLVRDRAGSIWVASDSGVTRFTPFDTTRFRVKDGLRAPYTASLFIDIDDNVWAFAINDEGVSRWNGSAWIGYGRQDGIEGRLRPPFFQDGRKNIWVGAEGAITRFDGIAWKWIAAPAPATFLQHLSRTGTIPKLWVSMGNTFSPTTEFYAFEPDVLPPRAAFGQVPGRVSATRDLAATFGAGLQDADVDFSFWSSLDSTWSSWSHVTQWSGHTSADGDYLLRVRARDAWGNVDSLGAVYGFRVDATPPTSVLSSPAFGEVVRDSVAILGTAADARFRDYALEIRGMGASDWDTLAQSSSAVSDGTLAGWNTRLLPDGPYDLRLSVRDTLGLVGTAQVTVTVDNQAPAAAVTTPARIRAADGGHAFTTNAELDLYFPPHAFHDDATVTIAPLPPGAVPDTLTTGAIRIGGAYTLSWGSQKLAKPGTLDFAFGGSGALRSDLALHRQGADGEWARLGGTLREKERRISLSIFDAGAYALFSGGASSAMKGGLSALSLTPRVFSPRGTFSDRRIAIGFSLGRSSDVTVRVYNRAGRLVREVAKSLPMTAGANLVWWDGTSAEGRVVGDGMYLVSVEASGQRQSRPIVVIQ